MQPGSATGAEINAPNTQSKWTRFLPVVVLGAGALAAIIFGRDFLSFEALATHYDTLIAWRDGNWIATVVVFVCLYIAAVACSRSPAPLG